MWKVKINGVMTSPLAMPYFVIIAQLCNNTNLTADFYLH